MLETVAQATFLDRFRASLRDRGDATALIYFDWRCTYAQLDVDSDALAIGLAEMGVGSGDRVAVVLQNVPAFVVTLLASMKLGAVMVPANPMYQQRELALIIEDAQPAALICHDLFYRDVVLPLAPATPCLLVSERRGGPQDYRHERTSRATCFDEVVQQRRGDKPHEQPSAPDDVRLLVYTSGTTGAPKGAMLSDRNVCAGGGFYVDAAGLIDRDPILGMAPLFHVTGLSGHIAAALLSGSPLILGYRFEVGAVLAALREHRPGFTVAAITALSALIDHPDCSSADFASLKHVFSGGAPISPAIQQRFREATGISLQNVYGLTETTAPITAVPDGVDTPVDPVSGALSVGRAVAGATIRIVGEDGQPAAAGVPGEILVRGPSISKGYWRKPAETVEAMTEEGFRTGDIGVEQDGWFYVVDRKKDMIIASGFKVWPREVEDVLYTHPAVREAAVAGVVDDYRGETVKAVVSLRAGTSVDGEELKAFCKARMAAYKYPRIVDIVDELPKTVTGKILRRSLR